MMTMGSSKQAEQGHMSLPAEWGKKIKIKIINPTF